MLDVTQADGHALAAGLQTMAHATGGTYAATYDFPRNQVDRLGRTLGGYYLLALDDSSFPPAGGPVTLELLGDNDVRIFHRSLAAEPSKVGRSRP